MSNGPFISHILKVPGLWDMFLELSSMLGCLFWDALWAEL
jgi:hypothetical protein